MSDEKLNTPDNGNRGFDDPITPIDFTPVDGTEKKFSITLSPVKIVLSLILLVFAGAAWFVLSARSVYLDVRPGTSLVSVNHPITVKIGTRYLVLEGACLSPSHLKVITILTPP